MQGDQHLGRINDILASTAAGLPSLIVLKPYNLGAQLHPDYDMPVLVPQSAALIVTEASVRLTVRLPDQVLRTYYLAH